MMNRSKLEHILAYARQQKQFGSPTCRIPPGDMVEIMERLLAQPVSSGYKMPDNVREALTLALKAMEFMGDTLNNIDAVCTEDVEYVTPAFNAVRELLAAAPEGGNDHDTRR